MEETLVHANQAAQVDIESTRIRAQQCRNWKYRFRKIKENWLMISKLMHKNWKLPVRTAIRITTAKGWIISSSILHPRQPVNHRTVRWLPGRKVREKEKKFQPRTQQACIRILGFKTDSKIRILCSTETQTFYINRIDYSSR